MLKGFAGVQLEAWSYFRLSQSIGICPPVGENTSLCTKQKCFFGKSAGILPVFFILFIAQSQKGLKNNGMTQSLQNPGVLKRQNSSGLFYSKTGPNTAQNLSVFCLRNLLAVMKPFYPCYNT